MLSHAPKHPIAACACTHLDTRAAVSFDDAPVPGMPARPAVRHRYTGQEIGVEAKFFQDPPTHTYTDEPRHPSTYTLRRKDGTVKIVVVPGFVAYRV
eukprot:COSAG05_NODE_12301_length_473_cov_1.184492_1_plen_97_part_00